MQPRYNQGIYMAGTAEGYGRDIAASIISYVIQYRGLQ